jgi:polysaccharide biosynthesis/export protein
MHFLSSASKKNILFLFSFSFFLFSCVPARKAIFFNGLQEGKDQIDLKAEEAAKKVYPGDRISIQIITENPDGNLLNLGLNAASGGGQIAQAGAGGGGYLVDKDGNIQMVKLGVIHVAGLTPSEVAADIKKRVEVLYKDPFVYCTLSGRVLFLGSGSPASAGGGVVPIVNDRLTILEALSIRGIGDPTAVREKVWVIREMGETREYAVVDINSKDIFKSPYFYLRNNDMIYMEPSKLNTFLTLNAPARSLFTTSVSLFAIFLSFWAIFR